MDATYMIKVWQMFEAKTWIKDQVIMSEVVEIPANADTKKSKGKNILMK